MSEPTRGYTEGPGRRTYTLRGPNGVAAFTVFYHHGEPTGTTLDMHSRIPFGNARSTNGKPCEFLGDGDPCYFDGTSTRPVPESPEDAYKTLAAWFGSALREEV